MAGRRVLAKRPVLIHPYVMRATEVDPRLRLDAAKGAAAFLHAKPTTSKPGVCAFSMSNFARAKVLRV